MRKKIKQLGEKANKLEVKLYNMVMDLDNHMNECNCEVGDDCAYYDFCNIASCHGTTIFCLNCGGIVTIEGE